MMNHEQIVEDYQRDGVGLVRKFFRGELVDTIRAELDRYIHDDLPSSPDDARTLEADGRAVRNLWRLG